MSKQRLIEEILNNELSGDFITDLRFRIKEHLSPVHSQCPNCKNIHLRKFSSTETKVCDDCGLEIEWKLKDKQKRII